MTILKSTFKYTFLPLIVIGFIMILLPAFLLTDEISVLKSMIDSIFEK